MDGGSSLKGNLHVSLQNHCSAIRTFKTFYVDSSLVAFCTIWQSFILNWTTMKTVKDRFSNVSNLKTHHFLTWKIVPPFSPKAQQSHGCFCLSIVTMKFYLHVRFQKLCLSCTDFKHLYMVTNLISFYIIWRSLIQFKLQWIIHVLDFEKFVISKRTIFDSKNYQTFLLPSSTVIWLFMFVNRNIGILFTRIFTIAITLILL